MEKKEKVVEKSNVEVCSPEIVNSVETLRMRLEEIRLAQKEFATFTQEQVDKIFLAASTAANQQRIPLAKMAVEETGMGIVEDKVIKNPPRPSKAVLNMRMISADSLLTMVCCFLSHSTGTVTRPVACCSPVKPNGDCTLNRLT